MPLTKEEFLEATRLYEEISAAELVAEEMKDRIKETSPDRRNSYFDEREEFYWSLAGQLAYDAIKDRIQGTVLPQLRKFIPDFPDPFVKLDQR